MTMTSVRPRATLATLSHGQIIECVHACMRACDCTLAHLVAAVRLSARKCAPATRRAIVRIIPATAE